MPTYEYRCPDCSHEFEEFQSMTAKPIKKCPNCGKRRVQRLISSGLQPIFKGSGFYETDYVKKSGKSDNTGESKSEPKPDAGSDSKPETKTKEKSASESKPVKTENKPSKAASKSAAKKK
ncbi:MAG: zinc ribbon domain-containing protein [Planctomycetes bacterium]|nr:zinc ribbon domain-containing protein [Planctomycetota bacterium]MCA8936516.1 zinc ribbon domain-containing protein [Planctomycetota bacterium]MCA8947427.1 zinc ribbon domain-containing protein [Planctomycetota bacterium]